MVRLDIPAPKNYNAKPYAFVEFEANRDAEDAFEEMHGRTLDGYTLSIQWARTPSHFQLQQQQQEHRRSHQYPSAHIKQYNGRTSRSRSPYRRERSGSPPRYDNNNEPLPSRRLRSRSRSPSNYQRRRSFSRSPPLV